LKTPTNPLASLYVLLAVLLLCSLHLQMYTATGRLSSVVAFIALVNHLQDVLDIDSILFADAGTGLKYISGASWCDSSIHLSNSLYQGLAMIIDDSMGAWPKDQKQQQALQSFKLAAIQVVVPGINQRRSLANAWCIRDAVRAVLVSLRLGYCVVSIMHAHCQDWCMSGAPVAPGR
jgi:hypothetical protein